MSERSKTRTPQTACSPVNRIECDHCEEPIETAQQNKRTVRWGFWDAERQNFQGSPRQEHYCSECWREEFQREAAAHFEVNDAQRLWDILEAADGQLVADLGHIFVGGRPWVRIINGELEAIGSTRRAIEQDGDRIIQFGYKGVDVDRQWFDETFHAEESSPDDEFPTIALLKPVEETPFDDYPDLHPDQKTFPEVQE